jgi:hypothetical protein
MLKAAGGDPVGVAELDGGDRLACGGGAPPFVHGLAAACAWLAWVPLADGAG